MPEPPASELTAEEEAFLYRLLIKYETSEALIQFTRSDIPEKWPDTAILAGVQLLLRKGCKQITDDRFPGETTVAWAKAKVTHAEACDKDSSYFNRLVALLQSYASRPTPPVHFTVVRGPGPSKGPQTAENGEEGPPYFACKSPTQGTVSTWGQDPYQDVEEVLLHVLRRYPREQQRHIATFHPDCGGAMLAVATGARMIATANMLLAFGADPDGVWEHESLCPLVQASAAGDLAMVQLLLDAGADMHAHEDAALKAASMWGHIDVVTLLQQHAQTIASNPSLRPHRPHHSTKSRPSGSMSRSSSTGSVSSCRSISSQGSSYGSPGTMILPWRAVAWLLTVMCTGRLPYRLLANAVNIEHGRRGMGSGHRRLVSRLAFVVVTVFRGAATAAAVATVGIVVARTVGRMPHKA